MDGVVTMLKTRSNKKLLQDQIQRKSDRVVTLKDISNYAAKVKPKAKGKHLKNILTSIQTSGHGGNELYKIQCCL